MPKRAKVQIILTVCVAAWLTIWSLRFPSHSWPQFVLFLVAVLLSTPMKVVLPGGDGSMSLNFPFVLLGVAQLSPEQATLLAVLSVLVQCRTVKNKSFPFVQVIFNIATTIIATQFASRTFHLLKDCDMAMMPALAASGLAYFFCNTFSVASILAAYRKEQVFTVWRSDFQWYLPYYVVGGVLAATADWIGDHYGWTSALLLMPVVYTIYRSYNTQVARLKERQHHAEETEALHLRTIEGLSMAIEAKDQNTHDHLFRVRDYVQEVGSHLKLPKLEMQALQTAAFLHDIGKLAVPEHIINKPGKLTPEEFEKMKIHPVVGADILERVRFPYPVVPIVRSHHERWDGAGYPDGLKGEEIPIGARILTVVDCFDALVSDRPYRKGLPSERALSIVKEMSGTQFDPNIVTVFEEVYRQIEVNGAPTHRNAFAELATEFDVSRGLAPGAGFQAESDELASSSETSGKHVKSNSLESLKLIAAASQEAQSLFELIHSLGNSLSMKETFGVLVGRLHSLISFETSALFLKQGESLHAAFANGIAADMFADRRIAYGEGLSGWVAQNAKPILNGNASVEPFLEVSTGLASALSVPLLDLSGEVFAVLSFYSSVADQFKRDDLRLLQAMESKLSLALQNALHFDRAEANAETDFLTGLPNARKLFVQLESAIDACSSQGSDMAVVVCDLNNFKMVNDQKGHLTGNRLLARIADEFRGVCGQADCVARMGGDEFVFLLSEASPEAVAKRSEQIQAGIARACDKVHLHGMVTGSLGVSLYPHEASSTEELLGLADRRMYFDKRNRKRDRTDVQTSSLQEQLLNGTTA